MGLNKIIRTIKKCKRKQSSKLTTARIAKDIKANVRDDKIHYFLDTKQPIQGL